MNILLRVMFTLAIAFSFLTPSIADAKSKRQQKIKQSQGVHKQKNKNVGTVHTKRPRFVRPQMVAPNHSLSGRQNEAIIAYDICVGGGENALRHAMDLAYEARSTSSLRGTPEKLGRETCIADVIGLTRYKTLDDIDRAVIAKELVVISSPLLGFPEDVPLNRRVARPWVRDYIVSLAKDMERYVNEEHVEHSDPLLRIPSTVRSFDVQERLVLARRTPANCKYPPLCSTHTTGSSVDISLRYLSGKQFAWLESRLREDRKSGKIIVISEFFGGHFHMFVIPPEYVEWYHNPALTAPSSRGVPVVPNQAASPLTSKPPT